MRTRSTTAAWGSVSRWLHWITAAVIILGLLHGLWMVNWAPRPQRLANYGLHSMIMAYFALILLVRIGWRLTETTPDHPAGRPAWEGTAAHLGHLALYAIMVAVVVTGYLTWSSHAARFDPARAAQMQIPMPGFSLPGLHDKLDRPMARFWEDTHKYLTWTMGVIVIGHVLAALRHHFMLHNAVLTRMLTGRA